MFVFDSQLPPLGDDFDGDEVGVLAVKAGKADRNFRRSYAWAKHALDSGKLKKLYVFVDVDGASWVHAVSAVSAAIGGVKLHPGSTFRVVTGADSGEVVDRVREALGVFKADNRPPHYAESVKAAAAKAAKAEVKQELGSKVDDKEKVGAV